MNPIFFKFKITLIHFIFHVKKYAFYMVCKYVCVPHAWSEEGSGSPELEL